MSILCPNAKDIEMCVCKLHLRVRWAIQALLKLTKKDNKLTPSFHHMKIFFKCVYSTDCELAEDSSEYIKWSCTQHKGHLCDKMKANFNS